MALLVLFCSKRTTFMHWHVVTEKINNYEWELLIPFYLNKPVSPHSVYHSPFKEPDIGIMKMRTPKYCCLKTVHVKTKSALVIGTCLIFTCTDARLLTLANLPFIIYGVVGLNSLFLWNLFQLCVRAHIWRIHVHVPYTINCSCLPFLWLSHHWLAFVVACQLIGYKDCASLFAILSYSMLVYSMIRSIDL